MANLNSTPAELALEKFEAYAKAQADQCREEAKLKEAEASAWDSAAAVQHRFFLDEVARKGKSDYDASQKAPK